MNKILCSIKHLIVFGVFILGISSVVLAKPPSERVEKDNAKVLFAQDENAEASDDDESEIAENEDDGDSDDAQNGMFEDVIAGAKNHHDNLIKSSKALTPKQSLLRAMAEDNAEQAVINRNHVESVDPLLKEGRYLYNIDVARERGKEVIKANEGKESELSLASSFTSIAKHKEQKKEKKKNEAQTIEEYKLKAQKLSDLKGQKDKKKEEKNVTYKSQAEALSESFK